MLGHSATPERKDGLTKVLHWFLGPMAFMIKRENQDSVNVQTASFTCDAYNEQVPLSVTGQVSIPAVISLICAHEERNNFIRDIIVEKLQENRKVIILSDRRSHCEGLKEMVSACVPCKSCGLYMGGMKQSALKENESCDAIFATYSLAHEGLDIPALNTLVMATPKSDVVQSCGRILRESGDKHLTPCIVDLLDNFATLPNQYKRRVAFYNQAGFCIEKFHLRTKND